jgi:hypothetical protein
MQSKFLIIGEKKTADNGYPNYHPPPPHPSSIHDSVVERHKSLWKMEDLQCTHTQTKKVTARKHWHQQFSIELAPSSSKRER